jgi:hypothetical protein
MKSITEDINVIKNALLQDSTVLELSEDKTLVRRKTLLPESRETLGRTVYVKGFPTTATLDELQEFFAQNSSDVQAIRFRRHPKDRSFKGSVFVEFSTEEEASRFATLTLNYNETPLTIKSKMSYFTEKNAERTGSSAKATALLDRMGRGRLLKISSLPAEGVTHEALKESLKDTFAVAYVDFTHEPGSAWIRFREPVAAQFVAEYAEKPLEIGEHKLSVFHVASEMEQATYYESSMKPRKFESKRGGRRDNKRAAEEPVEEEEAPKVAKEEIVEADETGEASQ